MRPDQHKSMPDYRADIDGLRAVAIIPVVLFHAGFSLFSGGYVGVDIFFVISGFLITKLILKDLDRERFSIWTFWARRVRRIVPAMVLVLMTSLVLGYLFLLPSDFITLAKSVVAQSFSVSNVYFWLQEGYFSPDALTKPLLHMWSLSVEEQFYFLFPFLLLGMHRIKASLLLPTTVAIGAASFAISVWAVRVHPEAAYYLLPSRAWELAVGATLTLIFRAGPRAIPNIWRQGMAILGLGSVAIAIFALNENTPFPGAAALLPVCGTALLIAANTHGSTFVGRALSWTPVVAVGWISYSWYLWHWLLLSFWYIATDGGATTTSSITLVLLSAALAVASWRYVEAPFRKKLKVALPSRALIMGVIALAGTAAFSGAIAVSRGAPWRFPEQISRIDLQDLPHNPRREECDMPDVSRIRAGRLCLAYPPLGPSARYVLWGDSHGDSIAPAFSEMSKRTGVQGRILTASGCAPILGLTDVRPMWRFCSGLAREMFSYIVRQKPAVVFLVSSWTTRMNGSERQYAITAAEMRNRIVSTIRQLEQRGIRVVFVRSIPIQPLDIKEQAIRALRQGKKLDQVGIPSAEWAKVREGENALVQTLERRTSARIVDPTGLFCARTCVTYDRGQFLYFSPGHLSPAGALRTVPLLEAEMHRALETKPAITRP